MLYYCSVASQSCAKRTTGPPEEMLKGSLQFEPRAEYKDKSDCEEEPGSNPGPMARDCRGRCGGRQPMRIAQQLRSPGQAAGSAEGSGDCGNQNQRFGLRV